MMKEETTSTAPGELRYIELELLIPTSDNVRTVRASDAKVEEMAESMRKVGVLQPVCARPHPSKPGKYDLRFGARRYAAAGLAGLKTIPVIVREMDDLTAMVVTVTENMEREDLTPMEESRAVAQLLAAGFAPEDAAAKLGKSRSFVLRRASLCRLTKTWQKAAEDRLRSWPVAYWERISILPADAQEEFYEGEDCDLEWIESVKDLESRITHYTHELVKAPWPLNQPDVCASRGVCSECPKRSGMTPGLFDIPENASPEIIKKKDRCLDPKCWDAKLAAFVEVSRRELERAHGKIIMVGTGKGLVDDYKIERCNKEAKEAVCCLDEEANVFWGRTKSQARSGDTPKNTDGTEARSASGDSAMRKDIAEAFATAHLAAVLARIDLDLDEKLCIELAACAARILAKEGVHHGQAGRAARVELLLALGLSGRNGWGAELTAPSLVGKFGAGELFSKAAAVGYFDLAREDGAKWKPEISAVLRKKAAESFLVTEGFIGCHLRADLVRVARDLGLKPNVSLGKAEIAKAIIDAKLPAGTLTPELAKAFGVKYSKPKVAEPAKKPAAKKASKAEAAG